MSALTDIDRPLLNRVILVTGATGTLGSIAAEAYAAAGATVILASRNTAKLSTVYDAIAAQTPAALPFICPLGLQSATFGDVYEALLGQFGRLDGLLHSAAQLDTLGPLRDHDPDAWDRSLEVNLLGPLRLTQTLLPLLEIANGLVVFTIDSAACEGRAYWGAYGLAKCSLESYAKAINAEYGDSGRVRAEIFIPGPVHSPLRRRAFPAEPAAGLPDPRTLRSRYLALFLAGSPVPATDSA